MSINILIFFNMWTKAPVHITLTLKAEGMCVIRSFYFFCLRQIQCLHRSNFSNCVNSWKQNKSTSRGYFVCEAVVSIRLLKSWYCKASSFFKARVLLLTIFWPFQMFKSQSQGKVFFFKTGELNSKNSTMMLRKISVYYVASYTCGAVKKEK